MDNIAGLLKSHHCGKLRKEHVGQEVTVCGWVNKYRDLGGLHFVDLRDRYGLIQLGFEEFKGDLAVLKTFSLESVVKAKGVVRERPASAVNTDMDTGEVEVQVSEIELLSYAETVPFLPHGLIEATEDLRLKYRYLDLRTDKLQKILTLRSNTMAKFRKALYAQDFTEVETPILYKSTPEGARDYVVPSRVHPGKVYALPQSPQTLKQLLMIGSTDKYFQITRCFRDEDLRADRQPEFTQVDIEVSFATADYMKGLCEYLIKDVFDMEDNFSIKVMKYDQAMADYGCDKPDIRFGLVQQNATDVFKDSGFGIFKSIAEAGGLIKSIFLPATDGTLARKQIDALTEVVKPYGGKGVAWFKANDGAVSGGISKFITDDIKASLESLHGESGNGIYLFFAGEDHGVAHACADAVRRHLGESLELIQDGYHFLWVNEFPLLEYDADLKRFFAMHHPFTQPMKEDMDLFMSDDVEKLKACRAEAYDLVCNGYEVAGGSVRIHNQEVQKQMFKCLGMSEEEALYQFGFFIEALKYGTPPHGGIAFGLDRLIMMLANTTSIRDVIAFPKTASATDMMASSPSTPAKEQIDELHFSWNTKSEK